MIRNDRDWLRTHFGRLVDEFGGQYVLIINHKIYPVTEDNIVKVEEKLRAKYGKSPIGLPVPKPQDFVHVLRW